MKISILFFVALISLSFQPDSKCILLGEVSNRSSDTLLLYKASDFNGLLAKIPIINNRFKYEFSFESPEVYELVFQEERKSGSWKRISFFAEEGTININIDDARGYKEGDVSGGPLNIELANYNNKNLKFWKEISKYNDSMSTVASNPGLRGEWDRFKGIQDSISREWEKWQFDFIDSSTSLLGYYKLMMYLKPGIKYCCLGEVDNNFIKRAENNLNRLSQRFPDHPYGKMISNSIDEKRNINTGGIFSDFQLSTIDDEIIKFSEVIASKKITMLNFWSKWCKVCVDKNKELIPIYDEFSTKGFEIVGVTENYRDTADLVEFIKQANYPWMDLIDFDGKKGIRGAYSVSQTGGVTFLIDSTGKIIGVNLNNEQLVSKIEKYLN
jgi:peroxiredoxin